MSKPWRGNSASFQYEKFDHPNKDNFPGLEEEDTRSTTPAIATPGEGVLLPKEPPKHSRARSQSKNATTRDGENIADQRNSARTNTLFRKKKAVPAEDMARKPKPEDANCQVSIIYIFPPAINIMQTGCSYNN